MLQYLFPPFSAFIFALMLSGCQTAGPGDAEVDACIQAMESSITSADPPGERAARVASGCARVYAEPECQTAHQKFGEGDPSQKARLLAERCAHAYCDKFAEPKPSLCSDVPVAGPLELAKGWGELRSTIWKRDLGEARAKRLDDATRRIAAQRMRASE